MKAHTVFASLHPQLPLSPFLHRQHGRASHMRHRPGHEWTVTHEPFNHVCACCVPLMASDFAVVDLFYLF